MTLNQIQVAGVPNQAQEGHWAYGSDQVCSRASFATYNKIKEVDGYFKLSGPYP